MTILQNDNWLCMGCTAKKHNTRTGTRDTGLVFSGALQSSPFSCHVAVMPLHCKVYRAAQSDVQSNACRRRLLEGLDLVSTTLGLLINLAEQDKACQQILADLILPHGKRMVPLLCRLMQVSRWCPRRLVVKLYASRLSWEAHCA